ALRNHPLAFSHAMQDFDESTAACPKGDHPAREGLAAHVHEDDVLVAVPQDRRLWNREGRGWRPSGHTEPGKLTDAQDPTGVLHFEDHRYGAGHRIENMADGDELAGRLVDLEN